MITPCRYGSRYTKMQSALTLILKAYLYITATEYHYYAGTQIHCRRPTLRPVTLNGVATELNKTANQVFSTFVQMAIVSSTKAGISPSHPHPGLFGNIFQRGEMLPPRPPRKQSKNNPDKSRFTLNPRVPRICKVPLSTW